MSWILRPITADLPEAFVNGKKYSFRGTGSTLKTLRQGI